MASSASPEIHLDLTGTFGISYIGAMVALVLYGITTLQSYLYYMYYPKDRPSLKLLVAFIWTLETVQIALVCHSLYHYLVRDHLNAVHKDDFIHQLCGWKVINYSNPLALGVGIWSLFTSILVNVIISTTVQLFFAELADFSPSVSKGMWWLTAFLTLTILAHFALGLETVILLLKLKLLSKIPSITYNAALPFSITAVFPDVLIAFSLCYFLHSVKSGFRGTNALLNTLMVYAVNRCLLTTLKLKLLSKIPSITYNAALPFSITAVFPDVLIAFSLCYFLHSVKSGFRGTNALLNTLMVYAVNRCLLTTVVVIVEVIVFKVLPDSFYYLAIDFCVGKLYANTLLATLNTRQVLRGRGYGNDSQSLSDLPASSRSGATPQFRNGVQVHGQGPDPVELTDLRATWPSGLTQDSISADSVSGIRSDLHRMSKKDNKDQVDITVPVGVVSEVEAQELTSVSLGICLVCELTYRPPVVDWQERDPSQKHVPIGP
ncbi:hypothetical protein A7U60_g3618 [Sanghuangporus baumii]|uniref:DUF6534 domain-containing protein n=1 Tax=Sanghuangporus baumii TaxID=108892 RepID=A0A9Q5N6M2_SANBA|nr:hypothetical protein A7U60_g3618 [Sanghuangporus baumii]